ncbi:cbb3-type cytochrome oxidase assembly protein CcoS [Thalassomonas actiniarum]|uniref:Cbb3-type cytochrome oxidase assembly protein CcoS n=1 Tax=Thalassomonas actiniarum TaxID=485447 RepID=A0AAF0BXX6_9GAMM|nr:cbb3-type cytochrome oxidase assembly protein CcoS [Thalassomonas actiniarum]WDD97266.1 cbb3-type cytochrome oxidase assembly protein CcoS [Thalassomonas actiniarum]
MSVIYVLIPIAVLLTALGIYLFFWAVKTEQFDDLEKQGLSILFDDEARSAEKNKDEQAQTEKSPSQQDKSQQKTDKASDNNRAPE